MNKYILSIILLSFFIPTMAQVGINTETPHPSSALEISSSDKGVLLPRVTLSNNAHKLSQEDNALSLLVYNLGSQDLEKGFYFWDGTKWVAVGSQKNTSDFIYMPSIVLPTNKTSTQFVTYDSAADSYLVDIYAIYRSQFVNPLKSSSSTSSFSTDVGVRGGYDYFILFADNEVFPNTEIRFLEATEDNPDNLGKFTYKVNPAAIIRNGSFMNIVLKAK